MRAPPIPDDEAERLEALRRLKVLDTPAEERFDRLTRLAKALFDVPIALVSLVDGERQWFKSRQGLAACETPRDVSFCGHAILGPEILHVANALEDSRFAANPLVTGVPNIRFYAGAPLATADGHRVGTLCIIDDRERELTPDELTRLRDLADCVEEELGKAERQALLRVIERHQRALVAARDAAEEGNRMKSEFLNMMSHELRTPLTVVLGYLPLLKDAAAMPPPEMIAEMAADMRQAGDHLLHLINDLLDLSKIEAGKMELRRERLELGEIVAGVLNELRREAEAKGLDLVSRVAETAVYGDRTRLRQILINLVGNAVKFTDEGTVSVTSRPLDGGVELEVADTGVGIPEKDLPAIFDRFRQVDSSSTRKAGGTGLGLAITRKLVELHGGTIGVTSRLGEGSVFTFSLMDAEGDG